MKQTYFIFTCLFSLIFLFSFNGYGQNNQSIWTKTSSTKISQEKKPFRKSVIKKASYYQLDIDKLKKLLENAPKRNNLNTSNVIVSFPNSDGILENYRIKEAPLFEPNFQAKHPNMRCYIGKNIKNPATKIRFSITPQGLHTMTLAPGKNTQFIDPVSIGSKSYMVYSKKDLSNLGEPFVCNYIDDLSESKNISGFKTSALINANDGTLRTYDLALASTVEYSEYHWGPNGANLLPSDSDTNKKNAVKAAMMVTMNRVNGIFEKELSLTMSMVDNTDIIFLSEPDGYNNDIVNNALLDANQSIIDGTPSIGSGGYDIGHVLGTGGGGLAQLNSPCSNGNKAKGATGLANPVGDIFDVEFVAHEMGHQFGAPHTWSADSSSGNCSPGEWSSTNAYEPGSGSTIMSYAGLCSPENVKANADDYFHQKSLQMIWANISADPCDDESPTGNTAPTANAGNDYTIPISTPYKLTGTSTDDLAEGTASHTFTWEQFDLATVQGIISESNTTGPLVRSFKGTSDPVRYIPNLVDLRFSNGSTSWEKLPSVPRNLNFQLTVRDNGSNTDYGQTDNDAMSITVIDSNGAFEVTSQNTSGISYPVGSSQTITWEVADTDLSPISTSNVKIWLSTDGGLTYPTLLKNTANDGTESVNLPGGVSAPFCRIMVEADPSENIFFAINKENFAIGYTVTETCNQYSGGTNLPLAIPDSGSAFEESDITVSESTTITNLNIGVDIPHTYKGDLQIALLSPQFSQINLITPGLCGSGSLIIKFDDDANAIDCANTESNEIYMPMNALSAFNGQNPSGIWTLGVVDLAAEDTGTLNSWFVELCTTTATLSNPNASDLKNLKVYPNPSTGEFIIKYSNIQSSVINISVYDIQGRQIYSNEYKSIGDFNQKINLKNAQSGMYLLNLKDGNRQTTRKIIIE